MNRRSGLTLVELTVAIMIGCIMAAILVSTILVGLRLSNDYVADYGIIADADVVMDEIVKVMRFTDKATYVYLPVAGAARLGENLGIGFKVKVKGSYLPGLPDGTMVGFARTSNNDFYMYTYAANGTTIISSWLLSRQIIYFEAPVSSNPPFYTFVVTAGNSVIGDYDTRKASRSITVQTTVSTMV